LVPHDAIAESMTLAGWWLSLLTRSARMLDILSPLVDGKSSTTNSLGVSIHG